MLRFVVILGVLVGAVLGFNTVQAAPSYSIAITGSDLLCADLRDLGIVPPTDPPTNGIWGTVDAAYDAPQGAFLVFRTTVPQLGTASGSITVTGIGTQTLSAGLAAPALNFPFTFTVQVELYSPDTIFDPGFILTSGTLYSTASISGTCLQKGDPILSAFSGGSANAPFFNPDDGRVHADAGAPFAAYCTDWGLAVYGVNDQSRGYLVFSQTLAEIGGEAPAENTLLASSGDIRLYRLATGELQINAPLDELGKEYVLTWDGCPDSHSQAAIFDLVTGETHLMDVRVR